MKASLILRLDDALRRKEHVLGELLSERAAALHHRVGAGVARQGRGRCP